MKINLVLERFKQHLNFFFVIFQWPNFKLRRSTVSDLQTEFLNQTQNKFYAMMSFVMINYSKSWKAYRGFLRRNLAIIICMDLALQPYVSKWQLAGLYSIYNKKMHFALIKRALY